MELALREERAVADDSVLSPLTAQDVETWNALVKEHFGSIRVDAKSGTAFSAELRKTYVGKMAFYECLTSPACVSHSPPTRAAANDTTYLIKVQLRGRSRVQSAERSVDLEPGDYVICDNSEPYTLDFDCDTRIVSVVIDRRQLEGATPFPENIIFKKTAPDNPVRRVAYDYLRSLIRNVRDDIPVGARSDLGKMFLQMAVISIAQEPVDGSSDAMLPSSAGIFERSRKEIERSFRDEQLTGERLARSLGISLRSLQNAFAAHGQTISSYIVQRRLKEARKLLSIEHYAHKQVSEIAYAVGFKSHAHFTRSYKAAFGMTPNASRALGQA